MEYGEIIYDVVDGVCTLTLNRPEKLNAYTPVMVEELVDAFTRVNDDDDVRVVIVTGSGRGFCAGADVSAGGSAFDRPDDGTVPRDGGGRVSLAIYDCTKVVIAAINGPAVGVGASMTLPMDVRIASSSARFGFVYARRGIVPEACGSWFLPRVVGISKAMQWVASGRVFDATEALAGGLIERIVEPDELLPAARAAAREIADNTSAVSVALCRQMMWKMLGADHPMEAHRLESRFVRATGRTPDAREGVESFLEKRPARFAGRVSTDLPAGYPWWPERPFT